MNLNQEQGHYKLLLIKEELSKHHRSRDELMQTVIQQRLTESLNSYYDTLMKSLSYLSKKDVDKLIKKV